MTGEKKHAGLIRKHGLLMCDRLSGGGRLWLQEGKTFQPRDDSGGNSHVVVVLLEQAYEVSKARGHWGKASKRRDWHLKDFHVLRPV